MTDVPTAYDLVAAPSNARRRRLDDGSEVATFTLADALAEPDRCFRPALPRSTGRLPAAHRVPAARPAARRPRRSSSSSTSSSADPGESEPPPPHARRFTRAAGLAISQVRWCDQCGELVVFAADDVQRAKADAAGFVPRWCPDCAGVVA